MLSAETRTKLAAAVGVALSDPVQHRCEPELVCPSCRTSLRLDGDVTTEHRNAHDTIVKLSCWACSWSYVFVSTGHGSDMFVNVGDFDAWDDDDFQLVFDAVDAERLATALLAKLQAKERNGS